MDIGALNIDNQVKITFDAFPKETFLGKIAFIEPAETIVDGVTNFKIKIILEKDDARLKSGLTANLDIITKTKESVLFLPQYAILENDEGSFVKLASNGQTLQQAVELGLRGENGSIEILSGVNEGDEVLNIGLKTP